MTTQKAFSRTLRDFSEFQSFSYRPEEEEADTRPAIDERVVAGSVSDIFDALVGSLDETLSEPDLQPVLWAQVNIFHRALERLERELDANEQAQRRSQEMQDGSEIQSVELEKLIEKGRSLIERRNAMEYFRNQASDQYEERQNTPWRPYTGSKVSHRQITAAVLDSREFLAARKKAETDAYVPAGTKVAFTGGLEYQNVDLIFKALDEARAKHPDMVLIHGGSTKGAELIASKWASNRGVSQIAFKPDWNRHNKAAPFKRNDEMLLVIPTLVIVFPGTGIQENLADKAKKLGIPVQAHKVASA